ncbi:MAG: LysR substrate-binding domain-containing protein [Pseudomonadota bacterium]|nr:LysR substrate-binding domain-containing protein [Pseudomonadota bacterium]
MNQYSSSMPAAPAPTALPSLDALQVFEAAARLGSFKAAAAQLCVTPTAVSHRIRALEAALGCPLFVRQVRAVTLTAEGQQLLATVSHSLHAIADTLARIRQPARHGVTVSVTPEFAAQWLVPRLAALPAACPGIDLHVHASYDTADLNAGMADVAVRYGGGNWPGVQAEPLFQECFAPVAAPALQARLPADARQWPLIHMNWRLPTHQAFDWAAWARAAHLPPQAMQTGARYSDGTHALQAALAGQGVALLGLPLLRQELRLGLLCVLPGPQLPGQHYHLCLPARRPVSAATQAVRQWLLGQAGDDTPA